MPSSRCDGRHAARSNALTLSYSTSLLRCLLPCQLSILLIAFSVARSLQVGYLRKLAATKGATIPARHGLPATYLGADGASYDTAYLGASDSWADIIAVEHSPCATGTSPDPDGELLRKLIEQLDKPSWENGPKQAEDDDCVYWAYSSLFAEVNATREQQRAVTHARKEAHRIHTYYRVRKIVFPTTAQASPTHDFFKQGLSMASLALSTFCQRILNSSDANIQTKLINLRGMLDECEFEPAAEKAACLNMLKASLSRMLPVATDLHGFRTVVREAKVAFLRPGYIRQLASRHGPFPRRQDLKPEGLHDGVLPPGRIFSLSHGWGSEMHPSPSGKTLRRLVEKLDLLNAHDEDDGVFFE